MNGPQRTACLAKGHIGQNSIEIEPYALHRQNQDPGATEQDVSVVFVHMTSCPCLDHDAAASDAMNTRAMRCQTTQAGRQAGGDIAELLRLASSFARQQDVCLTMHA